MGEARAAVEIKNIRSGLINGPKSEHREVAAAVQPEVEWPGPLERRAALDSSPADMLGPPRSANYSIVFQLFWGSGGRQEGWAEQLSRTELTT